MDVKGGTSVGGKHHDRRHVEPHDRNLAERKAADRMREALEEHDATLVYEPR